MQPQFVIIAIFLVIFAAAFLVMILQFQYFGRLFMRAMASGVQLSYLELVMMKVRKIDPTLIVDCLIQAAQGGVKLKSTVVQSAYLQGCDIEKLVLAAVVAKKKDQPIDFESLVTADLENRLLELLHDRGIVSTGPN